MRLLTLALLFAFAGPSQAAILTPGTWTPAPPASNDGAPHSDNLSWDGPSLNVGFLLGPGWEALSPAPFTAVGLNPTMTLLHEISDYAGHNRFGWVGGGDVGVLFTGPDTPGATAVLPTDQAITFWLLSPVGFWWSGDAGAQFALFRQPNDLGGYRYRLGVEDLGPQGRNDWDYNDLVVSFEDAPSAAVPEPGTLALLGVGLVGLARRRRG